MINLRYHIVSITAVFLALGIGVALGGTFLDQATVDVLNRNIRNAEDRIRETDKDNGRLSRQLTEAKQRDEALIVDGSAYLLADQLTDRPVLVVAAPGVARDEVDALRTVLFRSGANVQGTLELRDKLSFAGDPDPDVDLAAVLGLDEPTNDQLGAAVHEQLRTLLVAAGRVGDPVGPLEAGDDGEGSAGETELDPDVEEGDAVEADAEEADAVEAGAEEATGTTDPAPEDPAAVLRALLERDYVEFVPGPGFADDDALLAGTGHRYVFVGGPGITDAQNELLLSLLPDEEANGRLAATVASATQRADETDRVLSATIVARVRNDDVRRTLYNTSDELDTFAGLVAVVRTLVLMDSVAPGHYGQGDGASAVLPPDL
jgi:hypothetical protein